MSDIERDEVLVTLGDGRRVEEDRESGRTVLEFSPRPEFAHRGGIVQGGFITGWLDAATAHAVIVATGDEYWPASLEFKVSFLQPVLPRGKVRAEGRVVRLGRSICFVEGELRDEEGNLLATATSTAKLVRTRKPAADS